MVRKWFAHGSHMVRVWFGCCPGSGVVRLWFGSGSGGGPTCQKQVRNKYPHVCPERLMLIVGKVLVQNGSGMVRKRFAHGSQTVRVWFGPGARPAGRPIGGALDWPADRTAGRSAVCARSYTAQYRIRKYQPCKQINPCPRNSPQQTRTLHSIPEPFPADSSPQ